MFATAVDLLSQKHRLRNN